jgi:DNA polymerase-3 subunit delta'
MASTIEQVNTADQFHRLLGQKRARSMLNRSLASNRIAHAYLFRGPDGVGKKLFAKEMAKGLNCRVSGPLKSCEECSSCRKFHSGNHPDFHVETPEKGSIKIDRIREITKSLSYPPYESLRRVIVLEDIQAMRAEAANSLLKTLEEPPEANVLILTAEASKEVLPTIRSRCQVIPFFGLTDEETRRILVDKHGMGQEAAILARLSGGSPGKALLYQKTEMVGIWHRITETLDDSQYSDDFNVGTILSLAAQMAELKENLPSFLGLLRLWLRDKLDEKRINYNDIDRLQAKFEAIDLAERQLARNCNRALVCEILLFRLQ